MSNIEFFKQQSKKFFKDYNSRIFNPKRGIYEYSPRYFHDIERIVEIYEIDENGTFTLMNAQHIIAKLSGFYKWSELLNASEQILEIGKLLLKNREIYEKHQWLLPDDDIPIVYDWKEYESLYLSECDDDTKLDIFKKVFVYEDTPTPKIKKSPSISVDFSDDIVAQDMLRKIMKEKNLSPEKAISSSITQKNCVSILATEPKEIIDVALSMWGHADFGEELEALENPLIEVKLSKDKIRLLEIVKEKENISYINAIRHFMIFKLESLGYHI